MELWIARDKDGLISLFNARPVLFEDYWWDCDYNTQMIYLDETQYPEVTFENSPKKVELKWIEE